MARTAKQRSESSEGDDPGIDAILEGLEGVVRELESGSLSLEKALGRFEEGVRLARRGSELLDAVERRVEILLADRDETRPLHGGDSDPEP
jgi:exodeoxyribonuclease VII small subunit